MKSLLRKKFTVDKRILKTNLRKLIIRLSVVNGPVYQSIKNALSLFLAFFFECFRVNKIITIIISIGITFVISIFITSIHFRLNEKYKFQKFFSF